MPAPEGSQHRRDIQGLRALAVVAVVGDHLLGWPTGGFVGVDVFFVLSGFLITDLLLRERASTGRISLRGFYERR
ncbi:acyltransferase family protein, partial [Nocardioides kribbensis]